jgi:hypothetical protein|tara:strand:+ start:4356 stop:4634 length:279 start_codon:yes stop_codon:yes gene_type:complete
MAKYITINSSDDAGNAHIDIDKILFVETNSSTAAKIYLMDGTKHIAITGTGLTSGFGANVNAALVTAAQTSWTNAAVPVDLTGMTVTAIAIA